MSAADAPQKCVVLYTRPGCCLCDEARQVLLEVQRRHPSVFWLEELDIESDDRLLRDYLERIPVVTIDGQEAFQFHVDEARLRQRLGIVVSE